MTTAEAMADTQLPPGWLSEVHKARSLEVGELVRVRVATTSAVAWLARQTIR